MLELVSHYDLLIFLQKLQRIGELKYEINRSLYLFKRRFGLVTAEEYKKHLIAKGIKIGKKTRFFSHNIVIDEQRPWMIEIGNYCKILAGVVILQHDYSRSVLRRVYGEVIGESRKTVIGDNVFIGMNSIILMGSHVGNNVIIGAGSVVSGNIPDNVVIAGCPAHVIRTLDEQYNIRKKRYITEAKETFIEFKKAYGREPTITEMGSFWPLYLEKNVESLRKNHIFTNLSGDDEEEVIDFWLKSGQSLFCSYDEFKEFASTKK